VIIGIDPGLNGAIAALNPDGSMAWIEPMPTLRHKTGKKRRYVSVVHLRPMARRREITAVGLEWVWAFQGEAASIAFGFGAAYGEVRGAFGILHPVDLIAPITWHKTFGLAGGDEGKLAARALATEMWPEHERTFNKNKLRGSGCADAALIGEHHRRVKAGE